MAGSSLTVAPLGTRVAWMRDFAIIGAFSGALAPAFFWSHQTGYLAACGVGGAALGVLLGLVLPPLLLGPVARWPFGVLLVLGLGVGALWGAGAGFVGGVTQFGVHDRLQLAALSTTCGAIAGALQLGWFWLPYTLRKARGRSTWPVVVAACLVSGGLGIAALTLLGM